MFQALLLARLGGGVLSLLALTLSLQNIWLHLRHYVRPEYQLYICRILGMVPVYSLSSWLSLLIPEMALYFDLGRDSYEAYTLYSFVALLINVAGGERSLAYLLELKPPLPHPWPMNWCFQPEVLGARFLQKVRLAVLQFVLLKPLTAAVAVLLNRHGWYVQPKTPTASPFWCYGYPYIWIVVNLSVSWALYWMVMLYLATEDLLQAFRPLPKFLCVKAVIFFSWWQGVVLGLLVQWHWLTDVGDFTSDSVATGIQDLLICLEMFVAAIVHHFVFSWRDFEDYAPDPSRAVLRNFGELVDIRDMLSDAKNALYGPRHEKELRDREPMIPKSHLTSFGEVYRHSSSLETAATNQFMSAGKREDVEGARTARALREAAKQLRRTDGSLRWERAPDAASTSGSTALPESLALP
ncbi:hypothetical protein, conserved [Cyanidioschyzon merolae strain 10D]|jgi:hypothetical protein|uniref:Transmembrane protein 184C n=1 Tax=Cyanidioschyzon merolae (strain NIES-3377 / 10D) TaxID=280699 RepID=M1VM62_CYAM1|nr:hypothetical protein, conserved [Cyanidioschyzon merolae strain 10D]BAM83003.1 hypothetical protein, conserved [Cyanidioschyzon merolae strain 10D]|eukprot:XP_005539039.1 hypothetical protein, conserved [Cyanidioschyzon merolae strain 10D]